MAHMRPTWLDGGDRSRHRAVSNSTFDPEKRRTSYDSDEERSTVYSDDPLHTRFAPRRRIALRYHVPRRRFTRLFTCCLTSVMVLLAVYLVFMAWRSDAAVRLGLKRPPPPPKPHAWEKFPYLKRFYGGIRTLVKKEDNIPEFPRRNEEIPELVEIGTQQKIQEDIIDPPRDGGFQKRDEAATSERRIPKGLRFDPLTANDSEFEQRHPCHLDNEEKTQIPQILAYPGVPKGFPEPAYGSHDLFGLRNDVCFDRYGRLGPYGFGYSRTFGGSGAGMDGEKEGSEEVWGSELEVDYRQVKWGELQLACMELNKHRFRPAEGEMKDFFASMGPVGSKHEELKGPSNAGRIQATEDMVGPNGKRLVPRTAIVIRTWREYNYDQEDLFYLRALINELSLQSGTEYVVHFLIHVKDNGKQLWIQEEYDKFLKDALPQEFRGMATLWSEKQMEFLYPGLKESNYRNLPVYGVYRSTYLPLQYFAHLHPQYDFFWHWEMDARYTGHFYHLFEKVSQWAKKQPRKGLWERNARFYVPNEHGSFENFTKFVKAETDQAVEEDGYVPVWGPLRPSGKGDETVEPEKDPSPPTSYEQDNYDWGIGEEADFITFNPLFDPHLTNWILAEDVTGYNTREGFPPRRVAIITGSRLSRRLLETMHKETKTKRHTMFSEMWPGTCALHHGFKAVYAPHPVYVERQWPTSYLASVFNNGLHGASGGSRLSTFSDERQHNFIGTTWYYHAAFSPNLWKRWLGYKVDGKGGEQWEMSEQNASNGGKEGQGEGRMCLPAMLLHPIKQVDLIYEHQIGE